jgi:Flp pilus assembly protein TadD
MDIAEEYFKEVLHVRPEDAYTHVGLGIIAQSRKQYKQAKDYYEQALELDPNCQEAQENLNQLQ